jgi:hypothetical protein
MRASPRGAGRDGSLAHPSRDPPHRVREHRNSRNAWASEGARTGLVVSRLREHPVDVIVHLVGLMPSTPHAEAAVKMSQGLRNHCVAAPPPRLHLLPARHLRSLVDVLP